MGRILNLQMPLDEHGGMLITVQSMQQIMNAFKDLFPDDEIIMSPARLVPTDEQVNLELTESVISTIRDIKEMKRRAMLLDFLEAEGVDNWTGHGLACQALDYYEEHGTMDGYEPKYI